jgi:hypothetical protein
MMPQFVRRLGEVTAFDGVKENAFAQKKPGTTYTFEADTAPDEILWTDLVDIPPGQFMEAFLRVEGLLPDLCTVEEFRQLAKEQRWPLRQPKRERWHSDDFRHVKWNDREYKLTSKQAGVVEALWNEPTGGFPELAWATLQERAGLADSARIDKLFLDVSDWRELIRSGARRGTYALNA